MILQPAQVAAAQCNFVAKVIEYKKCLRYQLDCCLQEEAAKEAYLLWRWAKLDETDCTLPDAQLCSIQGLEILPSTCSSTPACADLLSSSVKQQTSGGGYTKAVENDFDSSAYMSITLTPNSVAQPAGASAIVRDANSNIVHTTAFTTGTYFNGATVLSGSQYHPAVGIQYMTKPIVGTASSYIKTIKLYRYENGNVTAFNLDISPTNIWVCGTCSAVNPADLDLNSVNLTTALKAQIENAVKSIDGALNIDLDVEIVTSQVGRHLNFITRTKHLPSGKWWGINPQDIQISYFWFPSNTTLTLSSLDNGWATPIYTRPGFTYTTFNFVNTCGTSTLNVNGIATPQVQQASTTFYAIALASPNTTTVFTNPQLTVDGTINNCVIKNLEGIVTTSAPYTQQWLSPSLTVLGTGSNLTLTNPTAGTYQYKVTFAGGECVITKTFTL